MHVRYVTYSKTCYPAVFRVIASTEYFTSYFCEICRTGRLVRRAMKRNIFWIHISENRYAETPMLYIRLHFIFFLFSFLLFAFLLKFNFLVNNRTLKILFPSYFSQQFYIYNIGVFFLTIYRRKTHIQKEEEEKNIILIVTLSSSIRIN